MLAAKAKFTKLDRFNFFALSSVIEREQLCQAGIVDFNEINLLINFKSIELIKSRSFDNI